MRTGRALRTLAIFAAGALVLASFPALPADGRIPIYQKTTISQPGSYYLTQDIADSGNAITIDAHGVTLDLDGHTITVSSGSGVYANLRSHLRITNGRISGGGSGVYVYGGSDVRVDHLTCSGQSSGGIQLVGDPGGVAGAWVDDCAVRALSTTTYGIGLENITGGRIEGNTVYGAMVYLGNCKGLVLTENAVYESGGDGIRLASSSNGNWIDHNTVADCDDYGIVLYSSTHNSLDGNLAARNGLSAPAKEGILFGSGATTGNVYSFNRLEGNGLAGIGGAAGNTDGGGNVP